MNDRRESVPYFTDKERVIIDMLIAAETEMYGLGMVQKSDGNLKRGTVYVILPYMEKKGFIESRVEKKKPGVTGPPRRWYRLTDFGKRLRAWELQGLKIVEEFGR